MVGVFLPVGNSLAGSWNHQRLTTKLLKKMSTLELLGKNGAGQGKDRREKLPPSIKCSSLCQCGIARFTPVTPAVSE